MEGSRFRASRRIWTISARWAGVNWSAWATAANRQALRQIRRRRVRRVMHGLLRHGCRYGGSRLWHGPGAETRIGTSEESQGGQGDTAARRNAPGTHVGLCVVRHGRQGGEQRRQPLWWAERAATRVAWLCEGLSWRRGGG